MKKLSQEIVTLSVKLTLVGLGAEVLYLGFQSWCKLVAGV